MDGLPYVVWTSGGRMMVTRAARFRIRESDLLISRVLIADDNALIRRQIRNVLEMDGQMEVCAEAVNGLEAVEKAQEFDPDVAVMDVVMPVMDGLRATRKIKALAPSVRVLIFALDSSSQLEWESKQAGADAILPKGSSELAAVVQALAHAV